MSSFSTPGGEPRAKPGTRKEMGTHCWRQRMGGSRMGFSRAASYSTVWEESRNLTLCCNKTSLTKWELSDNRSEISGGTDYSKPQEKKLGCFNCQAQHAQTHLIHTACMHLHRQIWDFCLVSFMFLELHASQLSQQPGGLGLKNQKPEIWTSHVISWLLHLKLYKKG